jgi:isocitrate lyase
MSVYADFQEGEFASEPLGYSAARHQREVGTGYFDKISKVGGGGESSTTALSSSIEEAHIALKDRHRARRPNSTQMGNILM